MKNIKPMFPVKKYTQLDFIRIPLKACPVCTIIIALNRLISALMPSLTVLVTAFFADTSIEIFNDTAQMSDITLPIILIVIMVVFNNLNYTLIYGFINVRYDMAIYHHVRAEYAKKRAKLEYKHIEDNSTWDLINRVCADPLENVANGMNILFSVIDTFITVLSVLMILMTQVWWAALLIMAVSIPLICIALKGGKDIYDARRDVQKDIRKYDYYHDILTKREYVEERSLFGYSENVSNKWYGLYEYTRKKILKVQINRHLKMYISSLATVLASAAIISIILIPTSQGKLSIGLFMGLATATINLVDMMSWRLSYISRTFAEKNEYLKDLTAFIALSEQEGALDKPVSKDEVPFETIEFKNVTFKYPGTEKYILKDFNLKIEKNLHYAFVGINGAGKTTITKLLTGMYDNYEGEILINGKEIREMQLKELKTIFAVVYQDFARYQIKAGDNIKLGDILNVNEDNEELKARMNEILSEIDLQKVIDKLPNGFDSYLGKITEGGVDLSGGEWQRVAVARALFNPAHVRILDEPTAALDPVAESKVYKMFGRISAGKTTIFITHRLGAARLADEIIVIDGGKVAEKGSHDMLMNQKGIYASMFESQKSWYDLDSKKNDEETPSKAMEGGVVVE